MRLRQVRRAAQAVRERTPLTAELIKRGWLDSSGPAVFDIAQGMRAKCPGSHRRL